VHLGQLFLLECPNHIFPWLAQPCGMPTYAPCIVYLPTFGRFRGRLQCMPHNMGNGPHMNSGQCLSQFFPACSNQGGIVVCQRVFPRHFAA
jgi:hypothetical protein